MTTKMKYSFFLVMCWMACSQLTKNVEGGVANKKVETFSAFRIEKELNSLVAETGAATVRLPPSPPPDEEKPFYPVKLTVAKRYGLLKKLEKGDTLFVFFENKGCFHSYTEQIEIYTKGEELYANLVKEDWAERKVYKEEKLTKSSLVAYGELEENGKRLKTKGYCTTSHCYAIVLRTDNLEFENLDCIHFPHYQKLKSSLFPSH